MCSPNVQRVSPVGCGEWTASSCNISTTKDRYPELLLRSQAPLSWHGLGVRAHHSLYKPGAQRIRSSPQRDSSPLLNYSVALQTSPHASCTNCCIMLFVQCNDGVTYHILTSNKASSLGVIATTHMQGEAKWLGPWPTHDQVWCHLEVWASSSILLPEVGFNFLQ